jgi:hypothetical protein
MYFSLPYLKEGLQSHKILIHQTVGVHPKQCRESVAEQARGWAASHLDGHPSTAIFFGIKADDPVILDRRPRAYYAIQLSCREDGA